MSKYKQYKQKFRKEWLKNELFSKWLAEVEGNDTKAHCNFCNKEINAKYADLKLHVKSKKHKNADERCNWQKHTIISTSSFFDEHEDKFNSYKEREGHAEKYSSVKLENKIRKRKLYDCEEVEYNYESENEKLCGGDSPTESEDDSPQRIIPMKKRGKYRAGNENDYLAILNSHPAEEFPEIDAFARSIAAQMKTLPEKFVIDLTSELQNIVSQKRRQALEEKNAEKQATVSTPQVITVTLPPGEDTPSISHSVL